MSFIAEKAVKAVRKRHLCEACDKFIYPSEAAVNWCGMNDGGFASVYYHPECRVAEVAFNETRDWRYGDDWSRLCEDAEPEDYRWLKAEHPLAYRRMKMTREQWAATSPTSPLAPGADGHSPAQIEDSAGITHSGAGGVL